MIKTRTEIWEKILKAVEKYEVELVKKGTITEEERRFVADKRKHVLKSKQIV